MSIDISVAKKYDDMISERHLSKEYPLLGQCSGCVVEGDVKWKKKKNNNMTSNSREKIIIHF
jgi:hypothetical protein